MGIAETPEIAGAGSRAFRRTLVLDPIKEKKELKKRVTFHSEVSNEKKTISVTVDNTSSPDEEDDDEEEKQPPTGNTPRMSQAVADLVKVFEQRRSEASLSVASNHHAKNRRMSIN